jgi:hypothetical protein
MEFEVSTATEARSIAFVHFELLRDQLQVEGADHPCEFTLSHMYATSARSLKKLSRSAM